jgi:hypothetical protein
VATARADSVRIVCLGSPGQTSFGRLGRRARLVELTRQLSLVAPAGMLDVNTSLGACLAEVQQPQPLVVIVSDLLAPEGAARGLESLQLQQVDLAVVHVVSPQEFDPGLSGELELIDAESGEALELGISLETLSAYRARLGSWLAARADECRTRGIRYARVSTDRPLASVVLDDLRRTGILK